MRADAAGKNGIAVVQQVVGGDAAAIELYASAFEAAQALDKLEAFASFHGPDFYDLPRNTGQITLRRESWTPPQSYPFADTTLKPLAGGEVLHWRVA